MKIGVIGGSIAGLASAILLREQGNEVTLLERSLQSLESRGAGIVLPEALIQQCIDLKLFDKDIPRIPATGRSFITQAEQRIWEQPIAVMGLNWADIYRNLHKRFPDSHYRKGEKVVSITPTNPGYQVTTQDGATKPFDFIVGADGIDSCVRKALLPSHQPQYSGYVAWRGTVKLSEVKDQSPFKGHIPYFVYPNGHLLLYVIPDKGEGSNKEELLNWVMYDVCEGWSLPELLTDKAGVQQPYSIPPGQLSTPHLAYLKTFAKKVLPESIAQIIGETEKPFLQAVHDFHAPSVMQDQMCLIGDAAAVLRPHTASGVVKALMDSISLAKAFKENNLNTWQQQQATALAQQVALSKNMGAALVTKTPDWSLMTPATMNEWWAATVAGKNWIYTTNMTPQYEQQRQGYAIKYPEIQPTQTSESEKGTQKIANKL